MIVIMIMTLESSILNAPQSVSNMYCQVARAQLCANRAHHIGCLSCATCHVPGGIKGQLSCYV